MKDYVKRVERQATSWDKIFASRISDEGHVSGLGSRLPSKKIKLSNWKMGKRHENLLYQRGYKNGK